MTVKPPGAALVFLIAFAAYLPTSAVMERAMSKEKAAFTDSLTNALNQRTAAILKKSCSTAGCHAGASPKAHLALGPESVLAALKDVPSREIDTVKLVDAKRPERSYLVMKVRGDKGIKGERMPEDAPSLDNEKIRTIELWVYTIAALARDTVPRTPGETERKGSE